MTVTNKPVKYINLETLYSFKSLDDLLKQICLRGEGEHFKDGNYSAFSLSFLEAYYQYGIDVIKWFDSYIDPYRYQANDPIVSVYLMQEVVRWFAFVDDPVGDTYPYRRDVLIKYLLHPVYFIRDSAHIAIGHFYNRIDYILLNALKDTLTKETDHFMMNNLKQLIEDMEAEINELNFGI